MDYQDLHSDTSDSAVLADPGMPYIGVAFTSHRREFCHLMAPPCTFIIGVSTHVGMNRGCHQNDSLADG